MRRPRMTLRTTCALCHEPKELCESHIIPDALYKPLFANRQTAILKSVEPGVGTKKMQGGFWEHLLCFDCEQKISVWEAYAERLLLGDGRIPEVEPIPGAQGAVFWKNVDYTRFKLFQMSVLWRSSVTQLDFFKGVDLGAREDELRQKILAGDPDDPSFFGCLMFSLTLHGKPTAGIVQAPVSARINSVRRARFIFGGMLWEFELSKAEPTRERLACMLDTSGCALVNTIDITELKSITDMRNKVLRKEHEFRFKKKLKQTPVVR